MARLIINGLAIKPPKSFQVGIQDIDGDTGRNANGDMVRDRITTKRKLDCEWGMLTQDEMSQLLMPYHLNFSRYLIQIQWLVKPQRLFTLETERLQVIRLQTSSSHGRALNLI